MTISALKDLSNIVINHDSFETGLKTLNQLYLLRSEGFDKSIGVSILGESGLGKTTLLKAWLNKGTPYRTEEKLISPIVFVTVPPNPTGTSLCSAILHGLKDPYASNRDPEHKKRLRVIQLVKKCNVSAIILDEIQHFANRWGSVKSHDAADSFKVIMDETQIMMVLSGLEYGSSLFRENEQLTRRFTHNIVFKRFDWTNDPSRLQLRGFLKALQNKLTHFSTIDLSSPEIAFRFFLASGGITSRIVALLEKGAMHAIFENRNEINLNDYAIAYQSISAYESLSYNPFEAPIDPNNVGNLIQNSLKIGIVA